MEVPRTRLTKANFMANLALSVAVFAGTALAPAFCAEHFTLVFIAATALVAWNTVSAFGVLFVMRRRVSLDDKLNQGAMQ